jgi:Holliday junction resolvasome RuvABC DNA-binding subunit
VGSRTAERIVLELTGKLPELAPANPAREEARLALLGLGYGARAVDQVLAELVRQNPETGAENLIRLALQSLP